MTTPQHMNALERANEIRLARAALRGEVGAIRDYRAGRQHLAAVLETADPALTAGMKVPDVLRWVFHMTSAARVTLVAYVECSEWKVMRELTAAQHERLVAGLRMGPGELAEAIADREYERKAAA